eukprot:scaffold66509_cov49-Phaeocystis_antarctica.AAC.2
MSVTSDVSKLSGWLNADALCRFETRAYEAGRGAGRDAGGRRATAVHATQCIQAACRGGARQEMGGRAGAGRT